MLTIDRNGNVGIGTTNPDRTLTVNGNASKPGGGSWVTFSDAKLKNIKDRFNAGLDEVMKLNPVRYNYYRWSCGRDKRLKAIWGDRALGKNAKAG